MRETAEHTECESFVTCQVSAKLFPLIRELNRQIEIDEKKEEQNRENEIFCERQYEYE